MGASPQRAIPIGSIPLPFELSDDRSELLRDGTDHHQFVVFVRLHLLRERSITAKKSSVKELLENLDELAIPIAIKDSDSEDVDCTDLRIRISERHFAFID